MVLIWLKNLVFHRAVMLQMFKWFDQLPRADQISLFMLAHAILDVVQTKIGAVAVDLANKRRGHLNLLEIAKYNERYWKREAEHVADDSVPNQISAGYLKIALQLGLSMDAFILRN